MQRIPATFCCLFSLWIGLSTQPSLGQTPAPALQTQFTLPLADKSIATAILLPTADGKAWLVYAAPTGRIGLWTLVPATSPSPTPPPEPPVPPVPPVPPKPTSVSVITITETDQATLPASVTDFLRSAKSTYFAFTVAMVSDPSPPANSLTWIGRSAGKTYPYTFVASLEGKTLWEGPTPKTGADFIEILQNILTPIGVRDICTGNSCPTRKARIK
jgi:hypothetical protein